MARQQRHAKTFRAPIMIPYGRQTIEEDDIQAVSETLRSDWLTQGPKVEEFEKALAHYCGAKHAVAMANGTAALQAAYFAAEFKKGDEFITTPITFASTASMGLWFDARPVFADIDPHTGNIDPADVEAKLTEKTRAIVPVDFSGRPVDLDALRAIAKKRSLLLIEDGCHALGASYKNRKIGSIADMTVFSFHPVKSITTGEGGAVLTNDDALAEKLSLFRIHGITRRSRNWVYDIGCLALNYRITDMQCALGVSQLKKIDRFIQARQTIAERYDKGLANIEGLTRPPACRPGESAWHLYPVCIDNEKVEGGREAVFEDLRTADIGVQVHYIPVYRHPLYRDLGYSAGLCPKAENYYEGVISLPIFPRLTPEEQETVMRTIRKIIGARLKTNAK